MHDRTVDMLAPLDQTSTEGLARAARHLELTGDVAKLEASVPHLETDFEKLTGKLEDRKKSLEAKRELQTLARARIDKAQAKRGASAAICEKEGPRRVATLTTPFRRALGAPVLALRRLICLAPHSAPSKHDAQKPSLAPFSCALEARR